MSATPTTPPKSKRSSTDSTTYEASSIQISDHTDVPTETETILSVIGMTCASCVNGIERHIGGMAGVSSIKVDLMTAQATVRHGEHTLSVDSLRSAIEDMGYDVSVLSSKALSDPNTVANAALGEQPVDSWFNVEGMTCSSC
ncbi:ATPase Cu transporting protein 7B, partial [Dipsacomyces acuminosporus]